MFQEQVSRTGKNRGGKTVHDSNFPPNTSKKQIIGFVHPYTHAFILEAAFQSHNCLSNTYYALSTVLATVDAIRIKMVLIPVPVNLPSEHLLKCKNESDTISTLKQL